MIESKLKAKNCNRGQQLLLSCIRNFLARDACMQGTFWFFFFQHWSWVWFLLVQFCLLAKSLSHSLRKSNGPPHIFTLAGYLMHLMNGFLKRTFAEIQQRLLSWLTTPSRSHTDENMTRIRKQRCAFMLVNKIDMWGLNQKRFKCFNAKINVNAIILPRENLCYLTKDT